VSTSTTDLLSINDAAPLVGVSARTLREMCIRKKIKFMRVGPGRGLYRFRRDWLLEYLASCEISPVANDAVAFPSVEPVRKQRKQTAKKPSPSMPKTLERAMAKLKASGVAK
jgi:excisionase family DNA binding protein